MAGYVSVESNVKIKKENFDFVVNAIKNLHGQETCGNYFSWVEIDFHKHNDIASIFEAWRWGACFSIDGDIEDLIFDGEKIGDENLLFSAIAAYVKPNSWIEFSGDESKWRYEFDGHKMIKKIRKVGLE